MKKNQGKRIPFIALVIALFLSVAVGFLGEFSLKTLRATDGFLLIAIIVISFSVSKIAGVIYDKKRGAIAHNVMYVSDFVSIAILGLNLSSGYIEANYIFSSLMVGLWCFVLFSVIIFTHNKSNDADSNYKNKGGVGGVVVDMKALAVKLGSDTECIKQDTQGIKKSLGDVKKIFYTLLGAIVAVALGLAWLMAKGFGWL